MPVRSYELRLPDAAALDAEVWDGTLARLNNLLRVPQLRLISLIQPVNADDIEHDRRAKIHGQARHLGRLFLEQEARMLRREMTARPAWGLSHYLLVWDRVLEDPALMPTQPPEILACRYREGHQAWYLEPTDPAEPYVCVLGSYEFKPAVAWEWYWPWADMAARSDGQMAICLDVVEIPEDEIRQAHASLGSMARVTGELDASHGHVDAEGAIRKRTGFYRMRVMVMLLDADLDRLRQRATNFRQAYSNTIRFGSLVGQQIEALEFFSDAEYPLIGATSPFGAHSFVDGDALPIALGGLGGMANTIASDGIYIGMQYGPKGQARGPLFWYPWDSSNRANHIGVLGQIGGGKTFFLLHFLGNAYTTANVPIIALEPLGHIQKLALLLAGDPNCHYHVLDYTTLQINILDWIPEDLDVATGLGEQEDHVRANIEVMLERALTDLEQGFLAKALRVLYGAYTPAMLEDTKQMPLLEDLVLVLKSFKREGLDYAEEADKLAITLELKYVAGGKGRIFNAHTNLPFDFSGATLLDAIKVAGDSSKKHFQTILYFNVISHYLRVCRREKRLNRQVRRIFAIDEYWQMSQNPFLKARIDEMVRTLRNLFTCMILAEQTLSTFARAADQSVMANMPFWFLFKLEQMEAKLAPEVWGSKFPRHFVDELPQYQASRAGGSWCIALLDQRVVRLNIRLTTAQTEAFVELKVPSIYGKSAQEAIHASVQ